MPKIACTRTNCAHNERMMCAAETIALGQDGGCAAFLDRSEAGKREVEVRLTPFSMVNPVVLIVRSNVPQIAKEVQEMGFSYEKEPPTGLFYLAWTKTAQAKNFVWLRRSDFSALESDLRSLSESGFEVYYLITEEEKKTWEEEKLFYDLGESERRRRIQELSPPPRPRSVSGGYWNGKVYGPPDKGFVFISGVKRPLSLAQVEEIQAWERKKKEYEQTLRLLNQRY